MKKNNILKVVLIGLLIVIVVLVVCLVLVRIGSNPDEDTEDIYGVSLEEALEDETYQTTENIAKMYKDGRREEALSEYDSIIKASLDAKDYDKFLSLVSSRFIMLSSNGECDEAISGFDKIDVSSLPALVRYDYYGTALGASETCQNEEKENYYQTEIQKLYDSGEVEDYEN